MYKSYFEGKHRIKKGGIKMPNKKKNTKNNKKNDERFQKINIKHDPQAESTSAVFNKNHEEQFDKGGIINGPQRTKKETKMQNKKQSKPEVTSNDDMKN